MSSPTFDKELVVNIVNKLGIKSGEQFNSYKKRIFKNISTTTAIEATIMPYSEMMQWEFYHVALPMFPDDMYINDHFPHLLGVVYTAIVAKAAHDIRPLHRSRSISNAPLAAAAAGGNNSSSKKQLSFPSQDAKLNQICLKFTNTVAAALVHSTGNLVEKLKNRPIDKILDDEIRGQFYNSFPIVLDETIIQNHLYAETYPNRNYGHLQELVYPDNVQFQRPYAKVYAMQRIHGAFLGSLGEPLENQEQWKIFPMMTWLMYCKGISNVLALENVPIASGMWNALSDSFGEYTNNYVRDFTSMTPHQAHGILTYLIRCIQNNTHVVMFCSAGFGRSGTVMFMLYLALYYDQRRNELNNFLMNKKDKCSLLKNMITNAYCLNAAYELFHNVDSPLLSYRMNTIKYALCMQLNVSDETPICLWKNVKVQSFFDSIMSGPYKATTVGDMKRTVIHNPRYFYIEPSFSHYGGKRKRRSYKSAH